MENIEGWVDGWEIGAWDSSHGRDYNSERYTDPDNGDPADFTDGYMNGYTAGVIANTTTD
jgi:hypothetical protein